MTKRWRRWLLGLLLAVALLAGEYYALACPLKFHSGLWQRHAGLRDRMLDDLLAERLSTGMNQDEVRALLGEPGDSQPLWYNDLEHSSVLRETYYIRDNGVFFADFLVLYYVEQDGNYIYQGHQQETVDVF